jgi:hypothetical protein
MAELNRKDDSSRMRRKAVKVRVGLRIKTIGDLAIRPGQNKTTGERLLVMDTGTIAYRATQELSAVLRNFHNCHWC